MGRHTVAARKPTDEERDAGLRVMEVIGLSLAVSMPLYLWAGRLTGVDVDTRDVEAAWWTIASGIGMVVLSRTIRTDLLVRG